MLVLRQQLALNRVAMNYPAIPEITPVDGYFGKSTERAVMEFQRVFNLPVTGIIDKATFYKGRAVFAAVSKLGELTVPGSIYEEIFQRTRRVLLEGDIRPAVDLLQYFLDVISSYYKSIPSVAITGIFDSQTRAAVMEFQKQMGLPVTGIVDLGTRDLLYRTIMGIFNTLPPQEVNIPLLRYPGMEYRKGQGLEYPPIFIIQQMLSYISLVVPSIPPTSEQGVFGEETENAVIAFQNFAGLEPTGVVNEATWNELVLIYNEQRFGGLNNAINSTDRL